jgi:hypothetical protein
MVWLKFLYFGTYDIKPENFDQIFQGALDSGAITTKDLHTRRLVLDSLCEGQGRIEIEKAIHVLSRYTWFDHERLVYLSNISDDLSEIVKQVRWPEYMTNHSGWLDHFKTLDINFTGIVRDRTLACLIRRRSDQRSRLVREILQRFNPEQYYLSYASMIDYTTYDPIAETHIPILLDGPTPGNEQHRLSDQRIFRALINLIAETSNQDDSYSWQTRFITEKTFKCFAWHQIPIWWTVPGVVSDIRDLGFDVFDDVMQNHDYDQFEDPNARLSRILEILDHAMRRIKFLGLQEYSTRMMPRLEKNWQHLLSMESKRLQKWPEILQHVKTI